MSRQPEHYRSNPDAAAAAGWIAMIAFLVVVVLAGYALLHLAGLLP